MLSIKLAYRNLIGAGLRTWLNVFILSAAFVIIIWHKGFLDGWDREARVDMIDWEIGGGQYWHKNYDPYDPFTLKDSHSDLSDELISRINNGNLTPVLIEQATIYPEGRMQSVMLKGIDPEQTIIKIPSNLLNTEIEEIPALIGTRMATSTKLNINDLVTVRWRDANGTFDAAEIKIVGLFKTAVSTIDNGQLWIPIQIFREMLQASNEATIIIKQNNEEIASPVKGWIFRNHDYLLTAIDQIIEQKSVGGSILYVILLFLAMIAIFDTQVLSIFRRQREIGTHIALGMTRGQVVRLFTIEGAMHGILAAIVAAIYGIPLLSLQAVYGFSMPEGMDDYGLTIAEKIFPVYSLGLVLGTTTIVLLVTTIVSFIPARKIAKMKPTEAIKGKVH